MVFRQDRVEEEKEIITASAEDIAKGKSSQSRKISGTLSDLGVNDESTQPEVLAVMHKMTHQKIVANDKWGSILMSKENIDTVHEVIESSNYPDRNDLLKIITRWKNGDFSRVDADHNSIWTLQGGTIGRAQGIMSIEEERWFIINNFGEETAEKWLNEQK